MAEAARPVGLTFTGVDEWTDTARLKALAEAHPGVEFAVLAGTRTGSEPRFPAVPVIERLKASGVRCAIHLCGRLARGALKGGAAAEEAAGLAAGVGRVQINSGSLQATSAAEFAVRTELPVIMQVRSAADIAATTDAGISGLWDRSGGRGVDDRLIWPNAPLEAHIGYAGGIRPGNAAAAAAAAHRLAAGPTWIDMESGVRTGDRFDLDKVEMVISAVYG